MGRWGDGEMGRWGDGEMGRGGGALEITSNYCTGEAFVWVSLLKTKDLHTNASPLPSTNHQQPTTKHQPPTTNHQPPTTNNQPLTSYQLSVIR
jgi:hypothetical protein